MYLPSKREHHAFYDTATAKRKKINTLTQNRQRFQQSTWIYIITLYTQRHYTDTQLHIAAWPHGRNNFLCCAMRRLMVGSGRFFKQDKQLFCSDAFQNAIAIHPTNVFYDLHVANSIYFVEASEKWKHTPRHSERHSSFDQHLLLHLALAVA